MYLGEGFCPPKNGEGVVRSRALRSILEGCSEKEYMSDYIVALIIPLVAIAIIFAWIPFLNLVCPPCTRSLKRGGFQGDELKRDLR
ncbi:MAG: hypothetical protein JWP08_2162 [Bryobacterales bacterium]|nr:hypothetical protein [Bryobacterales bacterium]